MNANSCQCVFKRKKRCTQEPESLRRMNSVCHAFRLSKMKKKPSQHARVCVSGVCVYMCRRRWRNYGANWNAHTHFRFGVSIIVAIAFKYASPHTQTLHVGLRQRAIRGEKRKSRTTSFLLLLFFILLPFPYWHCSELTRCKRYV